MKKVLMIAYSFPPAGGPGVQRTVKFVKYLRNYGWEPVILTRESANIPLKDKSLTKDIPHGINIIRARAWDLTCGEGIAGLMGKFVARKLLIPDSERLWVIFSKNVAEKAVENRNIQLIYTTSLPYSSHLMGIHLKKKCPRIAWVADFRDEWTNNPYILDNPYNPIRMKLERKMERQVLKAADCLITNTPSMLKNFIEKNPGIKDLSRKFFVIPNGYDPGDFKHINIRYSSFESNGELKDIIENPGYKNKKFTITYTGSFYGRRKPDIFFEALSRVIAENRIDRDKIHIKLIGSFKLEYIKQLAKKFNLEGIVDILPYMDHDECIKNMARSDCLLLIEGAGPGAEVFYTGKVFEYMVAGKPILAIIPEKGEAARLIRETSTGLISDCRDTESAGRNIEKLYKAWLNDTNLYHPNKEEIKKYERNTLTGELAKVFDMALRKTLYNN